MVHDPIEKKEVDILIVGGGLAGASLLLALKKEGYSTCLVESRTMTPNPASIKDGRALALSTASVRILTALGVWSSEIIGQANPIETIHVSSQGQFGKTRLHGKPNEPLGWVVEIKTMISTLIKHLPEELILAPATVQSITHDPLRLIVERKNAPNLEITPRLVVAADGAKSTIRELLKLPLTEKDYDQHAIVSMLTLSRSHDNRAYERFTPEGPLAFLPLTHNRVALIWAVKPAFAAHLKSMDDRTFLKKIQSTFGYRLGRFLQAGERETYPLVQRYMPKQTQWPFVFIGNAAHTLHPVAGQGFNLGLRDVAFLVECITRHGLNETMLSIYEKGRVRDQKLIMTFTDQLLELFSSTRGPMPWLRSAGLIGFENCPPLKRILIKELQGLGGIAPDLVCEHSLSSRDTE